MTEAFEWSGSNKISEKIEVISYEWDSELNNLARKERDKRMKIREEKKKKFKLYADFFTYCIEELSQSVIQLVIH